MTEIKLDPKYVPLIKSKRKTQTIRFGKRSYDVGRARFNAAGQFIEIDITDVDFIPVNRLDVLDAKSDGFDTLEELKSALLEYYPEMTDNSWVTVVAFNLVR